MPAFRFAFSHPAEQVYMADLFLWPVKSPVKIRREHLPNDCFPEPQDAFHVGFYISPDIIELEAYRYETYWLIKDGKCLLEIVPFDKKKIARRTWESKVCDPWKGFPLMFKPFTSNVTNIGFMHSAVNHLPSDHGVKKSLECLHVGDTYAFSKLCWPKSRMAEYDDINREPVIYRSIPPQNIDDLEFLTRIVSCKSSNPTTHSPASRSSSQN